MLVHLWIRFFHLFKCPHRGTSHGTIQTAAFYKEIETGVPHNG
jgi:hypothetical protein